LMSTAFLSDVSDRPLFCMLDHGMMLGRTDTIRKRVRMIAEGGMEQNSLWSCFSFQTLTKKKSTYQTDFPPKVNTVKCFFCASFNTIVTPSSWY
jgi:hypothetical protein